MSNEQSHFTFNTDSLSCVPDNSAGRPVVAGLWAHPRDESIFPPEVGVVMPPLGDVSSGLTADVLRAVSPLPSVEGLLQDLLWAPVAPRSPDVADRSTLGGGWLGKVRSWQSGRLTPSVHSVPDVHFGILPIGCRTTLRHRGSSGFPCITHSRPAFSRWEQDGG